MPGNPLAAGISSTTVTTIVSVILGLFGGGTLVALLRINVDRQKIVVDAAQGAVIVQTGVIASLREALERTEADADEARKEARASREEARNCRREVARLRDRVAALEAHERDGGESG